MRRDKLPAHDQELEADVADVEDCEEPVVGVRAFAVGVEVEVRRHAGGAGVADIAAVEEGEEEEDADEGEEVEIELAHDLALDGMGGGFDVHGADPRVVCWL